MAARARRTKVTRLAVSATAVAAILAVSACAETASGNSADAGTSVPFGASIEEYQEAFADLEPIVLHAQTPAPMGSPTGARNERYMEAVEEWSGGKITFEVGYSNAVASPTEADDALADGRLDQANVMAVYEPSEYPANAALNDVSFVGSQTPILGVLASHAWMLQVAFDTPALHQEYADNGVQVLLPAFTSGFNLVICREPARTLADFQGKQIIAGGTVQSAQLSALGASPVSIPYTEVFESLQRGVADCTGSTLLGASLGGYVPVANDVTYSPEVGFAITTGAFGMSLERWESLPLVVRQLLFDRLDVYLEAGLAGTWDATVEAIREIDAVGGGFQQFAPDTTAALAAANDELLEQVRSNSAVGDGNAFVDAVITSAAAWEQRLADELDLPDIDTFPEFADWWEGEGADLSAYIDLVFAEILLEHRPS